MKCTQIFMAFAGFATLVVARPQDDDQRGRGGRGGGRGGFGQGGFGQGGGGFGQGGFGQGGQGATSSSAATGTTSVAPAAPAATSAAAGGNAGGGGGGGAGGNPQTSRTLDPSVIASGFASDGQNPPVAGQVASLTSTNNFINFCVGKTLTNGKQVTGGSCNPAPIGDIPSTGNMPSAKFSFPANGGTVAANTAFTIKMNIKNLITGNFVNAQNSYFSAPQQLKGGQIVGHSHVVIELLSSLDQTAPTDPNKFAFFKGLNGAAVGGALTADVTAGLPAGAYRICSINSSSNHQPVIVPIAQHGSLDDCAYFTSGAKAATGRGAAKAGRRMVVVRNRI